MTGSALRLAATILLVITACTSTPEDAVTTTDRSPSATRFLALGDSYTIGQSVDPDERWPVHLARQLENSGISFVDVQIVARTGWTTSELVEGIDGADPAGPFDLVTLLIGVNNQFRGLELDQYRAEFEGLVDRAIGFAGGDPSRVIVVARDGTTPAAARDAPRSSSHRRRSRRYRRRRAARAAARCSSPRRAPSARSRRGTRCGRTAQRPSGRGVTTAAWRKRRRRAARPASRAAAAGALSDGCGPT